MKNTIKLIFYFLFISFFLVILNQSFMKPRGQMLFIYMFHSAQHTVFDAIMLYLIQSLPIIFITSFIFWIFKTLFGLRLILMMAPLYITLFIAIETTFAYIIDQDYFFTINNFWHYLLSFVIYSLFMLGLLVPSFELSSVEEDTTE